jgi:predicted RNase H-like HicB family nuclease
MGILLCMTITAIVHKAEEGGYWAEVPALAGCVTQGETMSELRDNLREAIEGWLEAGAPELSNDSEEQILELAL